MLVQLPKKTALPMLRRTLWPLLKTNKTTLALARIVLLKCKTKISDLSFNIQIFK